MTFRLSQKADADLISIYLNGIENYGYAQTEGYMDKIDSMIELIVQSPKIARLREEISPPVRIHPVGAHIIIYLIDDHRMVRILRIRHGRENWSEKPI
ncbi:type II toxin-antitoxin system RelE/ParE family toxin [Loktanella sp. D2R18]|uniref:type II toxin-antitoxin system RelE/ParE family toxin n=1 Tax=Rhodobacterales TaxID=204455 RepID=UPI000DEACA49|nr:MULTISPECIES: type II toxin-antitoxin system RelE/ParE family toxin [Rhodobacterales]MDO6591501.1 type II toxin-antitoxin system RelE/ParE family toxin [Yoonia sp. 1_MG-2023]RBW43864.1 type II toxin-antitoxin system RelE/ParE family toxin [Loktanella sp. D2R18]